MCLWFYFAFPPSALHIDKWLCHSGVSMERGGPLVVNVSACGLAGRWVLGGCEIPSLRNSTLASTPGHRTGSWCENTAVVLSALDRARLQSGRRKAQAATHTSPNSKTKNPESCKPKQRLLPRSWLSGNSSIMAMLHLVSELVQTPGAYNRSTVHPTSLCECDSLCLLRARTNAPQVAVVFMCLHLCIPLHLTVPSQAL